MSPISPIYHDVESIEEACEWIKTKIPVDTNQNLEEFISWKGRQISIQFSAIDDYNGIPYEIREHLFNSQLACLRRINQPVICCLSLKKSTYTLAVRIALALTGSNKPYSGARIDARNIPGGELIFFNQLFIHYRNGFSPDKAMQSLLKI